MGEERKGLGGKARRKGTSWKTEAKMGKWEQNEPWRGMDSVGSG
jgi:hypothetical protein